MTNNIKITPRQLQIVRLMAQGHSNIAVARQLQISPQTVNNHLMKLYNQLRPYYGSPRTRIVIYAYQHGLLKVDHDQRISESSTALIQNIAK